MAEIARRESGKDVAANANLATRTGIADERRASLVRAAYDIIAADGFERLRTRDIADRVGINVGTLHYYFPTKEALIEAVALHLAELFQNIGAQGKAKTGTGLALDRIKQEFADHDYYQDSRTEMITVMQELNLRAKRDPATRRILEPMKEAWRANIASIIAAGLGDGSIRDDIDAAEAAGLIVMALWGMGTLPLEAPARQPVYRAIEEWLTPRPRATQSDLR
jgi:TetR/AcrR family transcriptional regulator, regulator of cefoperazone and chloramphenicol sensitivity